MAKYKAYSEYKDSGVEWIGNIPSHWEVASLSKLFSIKAGGDVQQSLFSEVCSDDYPYPIYTNANDEFAVYGYTKKANYQSNTITVSGRGDVGFAVYRNHAYDAIIRLLVLAPLKQLECKFYSYFINSVIDFKVESSAIGQLSTQQISPYKSVIPSRVEQRKITIFLDHETAKIDNLIEKQKQLIELLKEKRQAVISHAVTKGLNPDVPMKDSGVEWLGDVPAHWDICLLKFKCSAITDGAHISPDTNEGEHYFVSIKDIKKGIIDFNNSLLTSSASYKYLVKTGCKPFSGDILFSKDGTIGQTAIVPDDVDFVVASSLIIIRADKEKTLPAFMDLLLQSSLVKEQVESFVKGAALRRLSIQNLEKVFGIFPTLSEQQIISDYIYAQLNRLDVLESKAVVQIQLLEERRTALISAAVTGKIDVRDWVAPDTQDVEEPQEATA
ncbi:restriction endonuclease subunit S [Pantoea agglomerans]|uniref:restriction endonuclease subunit S n=1 Tax=Enterobacter agglomerans TaxID=549 RepID=UPI0017818250|nr:restriction endonuclease subunit S [Pantoea agglomerans]WVL89374.1 restriction endonuclease subunit S [Pantoea agglomerans]